VVQYLFWVFILVCFVLLGFVFWYCFLFLSVGVEASWVLGEAR